LQAGAIFLVDVDELYGKPLRQSTLAGSQVKLFLAIDDLETANYLSEMLGDTTVKVTTPIRCPGGGCHAALKYKRLDSDISVA
jgi:type IV secretion system protein VirD4